MSESLRLHRRTDGSLHCSNPEPPAELILSTRWVNAGGVPGPMKDRAELIEAGEPHGHINCEPLFERAGADIIFDFDNHGRCRYEFISVDRATFQFRLVQED